MAKSYPPAFTGFPRGSKKPPSLGFKRRCLANSLISLGFTIQGHKKKIRREQEAAEKNAAPKKAAAEKNAAPKKTAEQEAALRAAEKKAAEKKSAAQAEAALREAIAGGGLTLQLPSLAALKAAVEVAPSEVRESSVGKEAQALVDRLRAEAALQEAIKGGGLTALEAALEAAELSGMKASSVGTEAQALFDKLLEMAAAEKKASETESWKVGLHKPIKIAKKDAVEFRERKDAEYYIPGVTKQEMEQAKKKESDKDFRAFGTQSIKLTIKKGTLAEPKVLVVTKQGTGEGEAAGAEGKKGGKTEKKDKKEKGKKGKGDEAEAPAGEAVQSV